MFYATKEPGAVASMSLRFIISNLYVNIASMPYEPPPAATIDDPLRLHTSQRDSEHRGVKAVESTLNLLTRKGGRGSGPFGYQHRPLAPEPMRNKVSGLTSLRDEPWLFWLRRFSRTRPDLRVYLINTREKRRFGASGMNAKPI